MSGYSAPRPIDPDDDLEQFTSGEATLDAYLRKRALLNRTDGGSRCYVTRRGDRVVPRVIFSQQ